MQYCFSISNLHLYSTYVASLDTLASAMQLNLTVYEEEKEKQNTHKVYTKEDFNVVNRFESTFYCTLTYYHHKQNLIYIFISVLKLGTCVCFNSIHIGREVMNP